MTVIGSLDVALSGLKVAQKALDVTSNNIANASTEGYTRKILPQGNVIAGTTQLGVIAGEIFRQIDTALQRDFWNQLSLSEGFSVKEAFLQRIQSFHGPPSDDTSIAAEISRLKSTFAEFENSPDDPFHLSSVLDQARTVARKVNDYADMVVQLRNDAQTEASESVSNINNALERIASYNRQIKAQTISGRATADLEDQRDLAIKQLAKEMDISFYARENGIMVVQSASGQLLADETARQLVFPATPLSTQSAYPSSATGVFINSLSGPDLAAGSPGGRLGALLDLRDQTLPQFQAQIDELAHKMSLRLDAVGLRLFTDNTGVVPADAPPAYVGYASMMEVNPAIVADPTLLRNGTTGNILAAGSSELIRRVVEFGFGQFQSIEATGTVDISAGTIFAATGLTQQSRVIGSVNINALGVLDTDPDITAGAQFTIDAGGGPQVITINAGDTALDLVNNINAAVGAGTARLNTLGQLILEGTADITIADVSLGAAGIAALGHSFGTTAAQDPSFSVAAGNNPPVTITIAPGDTSVQLLAQLNAVPGITASLDGSGFLQIQPSEGGDIALNNILGTPLGALGLSLSNVAHTAFRQTGLGADGSISTEVLNLPTIEDYARGMITFQGEEHNAAKNRAESETTFTNTLERRILDESAVDLDQEVARLIELQTSYQAAARMISASEELFNELLNAFR